jgi:Homeodomain-like domain
MRELRHALCRTTDLGDDVFFLHSVDPKQSEQAVTLESASARRGIDGLHDEPRPGKPRTIRDEDVERVIVKTLEEQPKDATHWSTRSMAAATGMSQTAISRIWRAFALKPHQVETFKLSPDPRFIDKVRGIVGLYLNPPEAAVVCCASTRSPRSRRSTVRHRCCRCCRCCRACRRGRTTTTSATALPTSTPRSMSPPAR